MQSIIHDIRDQDGEVVVVSTDTTEQNLKVARRHRLDFPMLSDPDLQVIDRFGLRHVNGGIAGDIARPATFLLNREGRIAWTFLPDNWRIRPRPEALLDELRRIP